MIMVIVSLVLLSSCVSNGVIDKKEIAINETKELFSNKKESLYFGCVDTVIVNDDVVNVIVKGKYYTTDGYFLTEVHFNGDEVKNILITSSGTKEHCLNSVKIYSDNKYSITDLCLCDSCKDSKRYENTHPQDSTFKKLGSKQCDIGCVHGY